jgi:soluble lytic murein transglycosylase-like protein
LKVLASVISLSLVFLQPATYQSESYLNQSISEEVPEDLIEYFDCVAASYNICPEFLEAIAFYESGYNANAKNGNHYGLMQINVRVHAKRIKEFGWTKKDMFEPYKNLTIAADYLSDLYEKYEDTAMVVLLYTGNKKALHDYLRNGSLPDQAQKILDKSYELERIHGK